MTMHPATSTNVFAVGYEPSTRTMRVQFRSGGVYDYYGVDPYLFRADAPAESVAARRTTGDGAGARQGRLTATAPMEEPHVPFPGQCRNPRLPSPREGE
jgi:hypothetical protein